MASYNPTYTTGSMSGDAATKRGLGTGSSILNSMVKGKYSYPSDYTDQLQGPAQIQTAGFVSNSPYQTIASPEYQGMDYSAMQSALETPVYDTYDQTLRDVDARMGGQGMYGSMGQGLHSGLVTDAGEALQRGLSSATVQRLGLEAADKEAMNNFNLSLFPELVNQEKAAWTANLTDAERSQAYGQSVLDTATANQQNAIDFANQQVVDSFNYDLGQLDYNNNIDLQNFAAAMQLAGQGAGPAQSAAQNAAYTSAANAANSTASANSLMSGIGGLLGGGLSLLGSNSSSGGGSVFANMFGL